MMRLTTYTLIAALSLFGQSAVMDARAEEINANVAVQGGQPGKSDMAYEPILELVRNHNAPRDGDSLTALFSRPGDPLVRQTPTISLSDGRTALLIAARITPAADNPVNFSLEGADLLSMKKIKGDEWQIRAMPGKGTMQMALVVMRGERKTRYPLTVAPPVPDGTDLSAYAFHQFFANDGGRLDLNGDGRKDYQDDYVFLANYLAKQNTTGRDRNARKQRALQRSLNTVPAPPKPEFNPDDFPD